MSEDVEGAVVDEEGRVLDEEFVDEDPRAEWRMAKLAVERAVTRGMPRARARRLYDPDRLEMPPP